MNLPRGALFSAFTSKSPIQHQLKSVPGTRNACNSGILHHSSQLLPPSTWWSTLMDAYLIQGKQLAPT